MAEILAAGTAAGTSSAVTLAAGVEATLQLFVAGTTPTSIPALAQFLITKDDGTNAESVAGLLAGTNPVEVIRGPGTYYVVRPDLTAVGITTPIGVWQD